jgi:hypothetical protein
MAMDGTQLAEDIKTAIGQSAQLTSDINKNMAKDIVDHIMTGIVSHSPGTVTGTAPSSGGPLTDGAATAGAIVLVAADLTARFVATFGVSTPEIIGMATAISTHVMTGLVEFSSGTITGTCGNTVTSPGPLVGEGSGGEVKGLDGSALAILMASSMGKSETTLELEAMCKAIVDHIMDNAEVSYLTGAITGTCSAGGGPIAAGAGVGGSIT